MADDQQTRLPHYAESFFSEFGRCFRMIVKEGVGHPEHCPHPVKWRGKFRTADGKPFVVDSCDGHVHDVEDPKQL